MKSIRTCGALKKNIYIYIVYVYLCDLMLSVMAIKLRTVIIKWVQHVSYMQYPGKQYTVDSSLIYKSYCHKFKYRFYNGY